MARRGDGRYVHTIRRPETLIKEMMAIMQEANDLGLTLEEKEKLIELARQAMKRSPKRRRKGG